MANLPFIDPLLTLVGYFGLLFLTTEVPQQRLGLVFVFALTGFMGLTLGRSSAPTCTCRTAARS